MTRSLTFGILFSKSLRTAVVAKPLILGILPPISAIFELFYVFLTSQLVSGISLPVSSFFFLDLIYPFYVELSTKLIISRELVTNLSYTAF